MGELILIGELGTEAAELVNTHGGSGRSEQRQAENNGARSTADRSEQRPEEQRNSGEGNTSARPRESRWEVCSWIDRWRDGIGPGCR
jgi:hypothetical protein